MHLQTSSLLSTSKPLLLAVVLILIYTGNGVGAFEGGARRDVGDGRVGEPSWRTPAIPPRRRDSMFKSLARVAKQGANTYSNHIPFNDSHSPPLPGQTARPYAFNEKFPNPNSQSKTSSLKQSSSLYVSQLHQQMQRVRQKNDADNINKHPDDSGVRSNEVARHHKRKSLWPAHFFQETLAFIAGGAAATSAFVALSTGAIFATAIVTVGALVSVFLPDGETDDDGYYYYLDEDNVDEETYEPSTADEGCDFNDDNSGSESAKSSTGTTAMGTSGDSDNNILLHTTLLDKMTIEELKKCFEGRSRADAQFPLKLSGHDVCSINEYHPRLYYPQFGASIHDDEHQEQEAIGPRHELDVLSADRQLVASLEVTCRESEECQSLLPAIANSRPQDHSEEIEPPKPRVEVIWTSAANNYYADLQSTGNGGIHNKKRKNQRQREVRPDRRLSNNNNINNAKGSNHWTIPTDAERDGALLLSDTFRVASSVFGLIADAVRFTGETAAAAAGGSARLAGSAVKIGGWAVGSLGVAIESKEASHTEKLSVDSGLTKGSKRNTRKFAGSSVQLVGSAIEQVAESLLLAGSATERVAFAAAGVAEGTVRLVEDFASSLSDMFAREGRRDISVGSPTIALTSSEDDSSIDTLDETDGGDEHSDEDTETVEMHDQHQKEEDRHGDKHIDTILSWVTYNIDLMMAETMGVASISGEALGVLFICFLASMLLLSPGQRKDHKKSDTEKKSSALPLCDKVDEKPIRISIHGPSPNISPKSEVNDDASTHSTLTLDSTMRRAGPDYRDNGSLLVHLHCIGKSVVGRFFSIALLPLIVSLTVLQWTCYLVVNKRTVLLAVYLSGWVFLSRSSQYKSSVIQRRSATSAYSSVVEAIGKSSPLYIGDSESALWLNSIFSRIWRVESTSGDTGGLEPLLSSYASASLINSLEESYSRPSGVAHVSLASFTLGSQPPIVRSIVIKNVDSDAIFMTVDVVMLLEDAVLMLGQCNIHIAFIIMCLRSHLATSQLLVCS